MSACNHTHHATLADHSFTLSPTTTTTTTRPALDPFQIPEIADSIFLSRHLSRADKLRCCLVNRHWYSLLLPYLWHTVSCWSWNWAKCNKDQQEPWEGAVEWSRIWTGPLVEKHAQWIRVLETDMDAMFKLLVNSSSCTRVVTMQLKSTMGKTLNNHSGGDAGNHTVGMITSLAASSSSSSSTSTTGMSESIQLVFDLVAKNPLLQSLRLVRRAYPIPLHILQEYLPTGLQELIIGHDALFQDQGFERLLAKCRALKKISIRRCYFSGEDAVATKAASVVAVVTAAASNNRPTQMDSNGVIEANNHGDNNNNNGNADIDSHNSNNNNHHIHSNLDYHRNSSVKTLNIFNYRSVCQNTPYNPEQLIAQILSQVPNLESLKIAVGGDSADWAETLGSAIQTFCPKLSDLDVYGVSFPTSDGVVASLVSYCSNNTLKRFSGSNTKCGSWTIEALLLNSMMVKDSTPQHYLHHDQYHHCHPETLTSVDLSGCRLITGQHVQRVLTTCRKLLSFVGINTRLDARELIKDTWLCKELKVLKIHLLPVISTPKPGVVGYGGDQSDPGYINRIHADISAIFIDPSTSSLQPLHKDALVSDFLFSEGPGHAHWQLALYEQIAALNSLEVLQIESNPGGHVDAVPFLDMSLESGLGEWSRLKNLREFNIGHYYNATRVVADEGLTTKVMGGHGHRFGMEEVKWLCHGSGRANGSVDGIEVDERDYVEHNNGENVDREERDQLHWPRLVRLDMDFIEKDHYRYLKEARPSLTIMTTTELR